MDPDCVCRHCDASFAECLKYLEGIIKLTALRREDDTATIMNEQKWDVMKNTDQVMAAHKDCMGAQRRDNLTMAPFQGPIGKYPYFPRETFQSRRKVNGLCTDDIFIP